MRGVADEGVGSKVAKKTIQYNWQEFEISGETMLKPSQIIEEKAFTFKTLTPKDMEETTKFMVKNHRSYQLASEEERNRLYALTRCLLIPTLTNHWSYGLIVDHKLAGVSLQIDVIDYIKILDTIGHQTAYSDVVDASLFSGHIRDLSEQVSRGDYVLCLSNVFGGSTDREQVRKELKFIFQGLLICRIGGWKNMLFTTQNPVPFLKINSEVADETYEGQCQIKHYLMKLKFSKMSMPLSPFLNLHPRL